MHNRYLCSFMLLKRKINAFISNIGLLALDSLSIYCYYLSFWYRSWKFHHLLGHFVLIFVVKNIKRLTNVVNLSAETRNRKEIINLFERKIHNDVSLDDWSSFNLNFMNGQLTFSLELPIISSFQRLYELNSFISNFLDMKILLSTRYLLLDDRSRLFVFCRDDKFHQNNIKIYKIEILLILINFIIA